ncbi:MAG: hypothetical protein R3E70_07995 [Burkholderiaceae bacterium]
MSITPEYFSRVLHELESAGLIEGQARHPDSGYGAAGELPAGLSG